MTQDRGLSSRIDASFRVVVPKAVRERLKLRPGDWISYRFVESGVAVEKVESLPVGGPLAHFDEWASAEDDAAYADL